MTNLVEGRGIVDRIELDGLKLSIEVPAGGTRTGTSKSGHKWEQKVSAAYGYILGTNSPDGEHLDIWLKKNGKPGKPVFVVHQLNVDGTKFDEDKVMLGYSTMEEAVAAFKEHSYKPNKMFGGCSEFTMEHFKVIAYQASNSSAMLASQKMFDKFVKKGLLPKGIKSPIQISQVVKEGMDMALHITYKTNLVAESAFDLALSQGLNVLKSNKELVFETEEQLSKFIKMVDESQEDHAHLGDLYEILPEDFEMVTESNLSDAIDNLKDELRADDGDTFVIADDIAREYGLDTDKLVAAFERVTNMPISAWAAHRDSIRRNEQNAKQAADKAAADAKAEKEAAAQEKRKAAAATRKANSPQAKVAYMVQYVLDQVSNFLPDGDPTDALIDAYRSEGISQREFETKYRHHFEKQFKAATGYDNPYDYAAALYDDIARDNPEEFGGRNPYRESIDSILKLAGVTSVVMEAKGTPTVHTVKRTVVGLNEAHNNALRKFMVNYAVKKQRALMESVSDIDMDAALRRLANTLLMYPRVSAETVLEKVAEKAARGNARALREHVGAVTGLTVDGFRDAISQRKWDGNRITRQVFESLLESTESNWNLNCPDKGTAFVKACL